MGANRKVNVKNNLLQLLIPLVAISLLIIFNLIRDPSFFLVQIGTNSKGNTVLQGNLITILNGASELAILAMGMTLVTSASGGQDISVGALSVIAASVYIKVLKSAGSITFGTVLLAFLACCAVAMVFGAFNGVIVSVFKIQPMIATLILFTCGRSIAYWINGGASPTVSSELVSEIGGFIPGIPVPTPIMIVVLVGLLFFLAFRFTSLRLYMQSVGINQGAARLNGINSIGMKILAFVILGVCCAFAGMIAGSRLNMVNHETMLLDIEMDAILAVAIGGNSLGGGKFKMIGSIIGAYAIQMLTITLYAMKVSSSDIKAYKAVVIIILVVIGSPVVKEKVSRFWNLHVAGKGGIHSGKELA